LFKEYTAISPVVIWLSETFITVQQTNQIVTVPRYWI